MIIAGCADFCGDCGFSCGICGCICGGGTLSLVVVEFMLAVLSLLTRERLVKYTRKHK